MHAVHMRSLLPSAAPAAAGRRGSAILARRAPPTLRSRPAAQRRSAAGARLAVCAAATALADAPATPVTGADGQLAQLPSTPGVYAVLDAAGTVQYVGVSRRVAVSVTTHAESLPELVASVKVMELPAAGKEELVEAWRQWIQEAGQLIYVKKHN